MSLFTQSAYILTSKPFTLDELETLLAAFEVVGHTEKPADDHWAFGGEGIILSGVRPGARVIVDVVDRDWVDQIDADDDPVAQAVWEAGGFGPAVFPGAIERAGKQAWAWKIAGAAVRAHTSYVRLRSMWVDDAGQSAEAPADRDPLEELSFLTLIAATLLADEEHTICYFNPNGEALRPKEFVHTGLEHHGDTGEPPLDVWTNLRLSRIEEGIVRMDSVGMQQLGLPDVEAVFPEGAYAYDAVDSFLRDLMWYLLDQGDVIKAGDAVDGPGGDWQASRIDAEGPPPRPLLRFEPMTASPKLSA
ncbi:MAG: DUF4261 domain-containing protein [Myxococcales bacterium]|nr:DUF4261 domain-containing protein [Myxococcales bacterium]MCB9549297.1 DUF4261 domain-containing protein [Myxococcales bacterium]